MSQVFREIKSKASFQDVLIRMGAVQLKHNYYCPFCGTKAAFSILNEEYGKCFKCE